MNILVLSDIECRYLWNSNHPQKLEKIDLILSCGDLNPYYLSFIATYTHAPVLYVHGNHDDCYQESPPLGCTCIEDTIFCYHGLRILGLGGSIRYKKGIHQYSQSEMKQRALRLLPKLWYHHGFDILLTHSPAFGINDGEDLAHQGFHAFGSLIQRYEPRYFVHGHTHLNYGMHIQRCIQVGKTTVVNAYERYFLQL